MKGKFVGVVIEKPLFLAKLASNGAYYYVTAKAFVRPSDNSPIVKKISLEIYTYSADLLQTSLISSNVSFLS